VGKQSTYFISLYTSMRNPYSTTFTAKDGNTRVPSTYLQVTASTEKGCGSFWKDLSPGSRRSEDPKWFCSRFLFPPFLIKKKKKKYPNCYVPPGKKIPVCGGRVSSLFVPLYFLCLSILSMVLLVSAGLWSPVFMYVLSAIFNASFR